MKNSKSTCIFMGLILLFSMTYINATAEETSPSWVIVSNDFSDAENWLRGITVHDKGNSIQHSDEAVAIEKAIDDSDPYIDAEIPGYTPDMVFRVDIKGNGATASVFKLRTQDAIFTETLSVTPSGDIELYNGKVIGEISTSSFTNLTTVYHFNERNFDIYINDILTEQNIPFSNSAFTEPYILRFQLMPNEGNGTYIIDNLQIYSGTQLYPIDVTSETDSVLPDESLCEDYLGDSVAFCINSQFFYSAREKKMMPAASYSKNNELYIPAESFAEAFGYTISKNESTLFFGDDISLDILSGTLYVYGSQYTVPACEKNADHIFVPAVSLAEAALGLTAKTYQTGLTIFSDSFPDYSDDSSAIKILTAQLFSYHPDISDIINSFDASGYKNVHPRLHADAEDFEHLKELCNTNQNIRKWTSGIICKADSLLNEAPLEYDIPDGLRLLNVSRAVQDRLLCLGYSYRITGDTKYAQRAWTEMEKVCSYSDWNPRHFLDTAEMAYGVAVGYDWCYDYLSEEQRKTIESAIVKLGLEEGKKQYTGSPTGTNFVFQDMNWNVVCNGGLSAAALAVIDSYPDIAAYTLKNALRSLDYMIAEFAPDGGWVEGPDYWTYAAKFFCIWMDCIKYPLGTDYGLPNFPGINKTCDYIFSLQGNRGSNNFNDGYSQNCISPEVLWFGRYFENENITSSYLLYQDMSGIDGTVYDCLYYDTSVTERKNTMPLDNVTRNVESGSMRSSWDDLSGMWLSYHGGKTLVNHYHISAGSFVLDALGERWALDLGTEPLTYSAEFSGGRNSLYRIRPEGHNCIVIDPSDAPGQELSADCPIISSESKPKGAYQVLDLTSAYSSQAYSALRGFMLTDNRQTAIIRDELSLKQDSDVYWFMHTAADIEILSDTSAKLTISQKSMKLDMICTGGTASLSAAEAKPFPTTPIINGQASNSGIQKLQILVSGSGKVTVSVRLTPYEGEYAETDFICSDISDWSIPDGELPTQPEDENQYYVFYRGFDDIVPASPAASWDYNDLSAQWNASAQNSRTTIQTAQGLGENSSKSLAVITSGYHGGSGYDPFIKVTPYRNTEDTAILEFKLYLEGHDAEYAVQANNQSILKFLTDGTVNIPSRGKVGTWQEKKWMCISITLNYISGKAKIWLDGKELPFAAAINLSAPQSVKWLALYPEDMSADGYDGIFAVDNVRFYTGDTEMYCTVKETGDIVLSCRYPYTAIAAQHDNGILASVQIGKLGDVLHLPSSGSISLYQWDSLDSMLPIEKALDLTNNTE